MVIAMIYGSVYQTVLYLKWNMPIFTLLQALHWPLTSVRRYLSSFTSPTLLPYTTEYWNIAVHNLPCPLHIFITPVSLSLLFYHILQRSIELGYVNMTVPNRQDALSLWLLHRACFVSMATTIGRAS